MPLAKCRAICLWYICMHFFHSHCIYAALHIVVSFKMWTKRPQQRICSRFEWQSIFGCFLQIDWKKDLEQQYEHNMNMNANHTQKKRLPKPSSNISFLTCTSINFQFDDRFCIARLYNAKLTDGLHFNHSFLTQTKIERVFLYHLSTSVSLFLELEARLHTLWRRTWKAEIFNLFFHHVFHTNESTSLKNRNSNLCQNNAKGGLFSMCLWFINCELITFHSNCSICDTYCVSRIEHRFLFDSDPQFKLRALIFPHN